MVFLLTYLMCNVTKVSGSDSRWQASGYGTAFNTDWMNNVLYGLASFMVIRQSTMWRWSHIWHHSDTLLWGKNPEIAVPCPPAVKGILLNFFALRTLTVEFKRSIDHAGGKTNPGVATYLPVSDYRKAKAGIYLMIFACVIGLSIYSGGILSLLYIGIPTFVGTWLLPIYMLIQHAGLAENVLNYRLNCRTVYMNRMNRFLYRNKNYHVEHHMFPLVSNPQLPELHKIIKADCPIPYNAIIEAYRKINPALSAKINNNYISIWVKQSLLKYLIVNT